MFLPTSFVVLSSFLFNTYSVQAGSEILRPRGVPLSKKIFYDPSKDFQCLDGSATIPFRQVNDDYCDCPDGSDEPGTSACPNGVFHCSNIGYLEKSLPSGFVHDGICDCCDGSDEEGGNKIQCVNNCQQLGEQLRREREEYLDLLRRGNEVRQQYIEQSKVALENAKVELENVKAQLIDAETLKNSKLEIKNQAEALEKEALDKHRQEEDKLKETRDRELQAQKDAYDLQRSSNVFLQLDLNSDGILTAEEIKTNPLFDTDKDGKVSDEEASFYMENLEKVTREEFISSSWPLIRPLYDQQHSEPSHETESHDSENVFQNPDNEHPEEHSDQLPAYETEEEFKPHEESNLIEPAPPQEPEPVHLEHDDATKALIDEARNAREEHAKAEGDFLSLQNKVRELEILFENDYGINGEYLILRGQCFEFTDMEYIYKLCPFDQASQRPKHGGSETSLGRWSKWIGSENNRYERFLMDHGVQCWNGPVRTAVVNVGCGTENQITKVSEPSRCAYAFEFLTPAACVLNESMAAPHESHEHTEL